MTGTSNILPWHRHADNHKVKECSQNSRHPVLLTATLYNVSNTEVAPATKVIAVLTV